MTQNGKESKHQQASRPAKSLHPALKLRYSLRGHRHFVYRMALSPDGHTLASPSEDGTVRLWDLESGQVLRSLEHEDRPVCVAWKPDGVILATGTGDLSKVYLWEVASGKRLRILEGHELGVTGAAWSPDGTVLATCSMDKTVRLWDAVSGQELRKFKGHSSGVESVAWSPDGSRLCSASTDMSVKLWKVETGNNVRTLSGHKDDAYSAVWSPIRHQIASSSADKTVRIWDTETGQELYVLEGHTDRVVSIVYLDNGGLLASLDESGALTIRRTDTWVEVLRTAKIGDVGLLANLAVHPTLQVMAVADERQRSINIWDLDFARLRVAESASPTVFYVNAKAVLLGDSSVGKSGLGIRIAEGAFRQTESTHGAQFWHFPTERLKALSPNVQAELTLWDLAGQPDYRLTHQLFLDDTDAALLLFDCSDPSDPFRGVRYWAKVLRKNAPNAKKLLVSARCDVSPVTVDRSTINRMLATFGLDEYFRTSAKTGEGVEQVFKCLMDEIPWDRLPRTGTPKLFQVVREFLLDRKQSGAAVIGMKDVQRAAAVGYAERAATQAELDTVVQLLQSRGLVHRLEPRPGIVWVLLKPELINQYGASIVQAARNHALGIGTVPERDVLTGNIVFTGFERLPRAEEMLVLEGTAELLIRHDLGFREMGNLVFPSQINVSRLPPEEAHPRTEVAYKFSGSIETIYASLVVRLTYTDYFRREDQWKYAVEFSRGDRRLGFSMRQVEEGTGELEIYFQPGISEFDRVTFIRFVTDHLHAKGIAIEEQIRLYCPRCAKEVTNREAIEARVQDGKLDILCQFCETAIVIPMSVEEIYRRDPSMSQRQQQLITTVKQRTDAEVKQFRSDQQQYTAAENHQIHILHLSDLHFGDEAFTTVFRTQLESDLIQELGIRRLEYLVISGDLANRATEKEYDAAFSMVDGLVKRFGLDVSRVVVVPGNHDVNWDKSEQAYPFVTKRKLPLPLPTEKSIPAGEAGALLCDEAVYHERFAHFNTHFYRRVYPQKDYPPAYADQTLLVERPEDRILFLGLNSCWQLDHYFRNRASIHLPAITKALDQLQDARYQGWLKIAVWHHPVTGQQPMNDEFMQLLAVHRFQVGLHGHIHEAIQGFFHYDDRRDIRIIGAGTFGAPVNEQVAGIPLQYNLLTFDPQTCEMTVNTRKKEKPAGAWSADARWGDKNNPRSSYQFVVPHYRSSG